MTHIILLLYCYVEPYKVHLAILYSSKWKNAYANLSERIFDDKVITEIISFQSVFDNQKLYFKCHSEEAFGYDTIKGKI